MIPAAPPEPALGLGAISSPNASSSADGSDVSTGEYLHENRRIKEWIILDHILMRECKMKLYVRYSSRW
jgi:hypothetical protein